MRQEETVEILVEQNRLLGGTARTKPSDSVYKQREEHIWFMFVACHTYTICLFYAAPPASFTYVFKMKLLD